MKTDDNAARIVFDFGGNTNDIIFEYIVFEEVNLLQPTSARLIKDVKTKIFPNPFNQQLFINNIDDFQKLSIFNQQGSLIKSMALSPALNATNLSELQSGIYFVLLSNNIVNVTRKIIKN